MIKITNEAEFEQIIATTDGLIVVDFNADWCGPCRMLATVLDQLATENPQIKILSVNVDQQKELAQRFQVQSIPCVVFIQYGVEIHRNVGFTPKSVFVEMLQELQA